MTAAQVGIELSPTACRIVEVDGGSPWRRAQGDSRVMSFSVLPPSGPETQAKLASLRRRSAAVVVWGTRSEHQQVMVTSGSYEFMRAQALASLSAAGRQTAGTWTDIAPASRPDDRAARRPVVVVMTSAADMIDALSPLREAGIRLRTVTTPAVALGSLARMRRAIAVPDVIESYVALDEQITSIALVRSGVLLAARDVPWGFVDGDYSRSGLRSRDDITMRLAGTISDFVAAIGAAPGALGQICLCGGLPDLRSMSALLMERLDVEVEPLDSLFGIDAARLPGPADEFRERGAELRLAWAAAVEWPPAINMLRARRRQRSKTWLSRAAVAAGTAVGLAGGWWLVERDQLGPTPQPLAKMTADRTARSRAAVAAPPRAPAAAVRMTPLERRAGPLDPPPGGKTPASGEVNRFEAPTLSRTLAANKAPVVMPPAAAVSREPVPTRAASVTGASTIVVPRRKATETAADPRATPTLERAANARPATSRPAAAVVADRPRRIEAPRRVKPPPMAEIATPFEAALGTILYSPDRKLAIIDGRIVGIGDEVRGARIIEIDPAAVLLRDGEGRLRKLAMGSGGH